MCPPAPVRSWSRRRSPARFPRSRLRLRPFRFKFRPINSQRNNPLRLRSQRHRASSNRRSNESASRRSHLDGRSAPNWTCHHVRASRYSSNDRLRCESWRAAMAIFAAVETPNGVAGLRDLTPEDIPAIIDYWLSSTDEYFAFLGVDRERLGGADDIRTRYLNAIRTGDPAQPTISLAATLDA